MNKNKILNECIVIFDRHLQINLKEAMGLTLRELFHKAENATSNQDEQNYFTQYRQLKSGAKDLSNLIRRQIKSMPDFISAEVNKSDSKMSLSLVEDEELSITLALTQLDSTLEVVSHGELYTLEKRMNVIFGNEHIDKTNMPFSPASMVWMLSHAMKGVAFMVEVKTAIIEHLTKELSKQINQAYGEINQVFIDAGILPNIQPELRKKRSESKPESEPKPSAETEEANAQAPEQTGAKRAEQAANPNADAYKQFDPQTKEIVDSIFNMLTPPQTGHHGGGGSSDAGQSISDNDFDQALAQIAQESGVVATSKNIHNLKEMLSDQVKNNTGNYYPELTPRQHKTLDLMGMVYDEIEKDESIDTHIRSSFNAINVPLLRMAVNDERFFTDAAHPARQFMELLVESSQKWHGTNVVKKIHQYSDSAAKSFDGSASSFVKSLEELNDYLEVTQNRAEKAEKKWISAAQGKEKMAMTKAEVDEHLEEILAGCEIKFIQDIIHHVWKDSLTLDPVTGRQRIRAMGTQNQVSQNHRPIWQQRKFSPVKRAREVGGFAPHGSNHGRIGFFETRPHFGQRQHSCVHGLAGVRRSQE